jgi:hypothetical protein
MFTRLFHALAALAAGGALLGCAFDEEGGDLDGSESSDPSTSTDRADDSTDPMDLGAAGQVRYRGARVLAAIKRPNAGVVRFLVSDSAAGVGCDELVPADGVARAARSSSDPRSCLELYLDLTEPTAPIPAELVARSVLPDAARLAAGRQIVESIATPLRSSEALLFSGGDQETTPHSCDGDAGSQAHFEAEHCDSSGGSGVIEYCDSGQWFDLYRTTAGAKRRHSFTEILSCTALADVIHEWWNGTSWPNVYVIENIPGDYYHWSHWEGDANWQRRVHTYRVFASGFFRSHTVFWNN